MKINFLLPHLKNSGGIKISLTYANRLSERGHEVAITTPSSFSKIIKNYFIKECRWFGKLKPKVVLLRSLSEDNITKADVTVADSWKMADKLLAFNINCCVVQLIQHDERLFHGKKEAVEMVYRRDLPKIVVSSWLEEIFEKEFNQQVLKLINPIDEEYINSIKRVKKNDVNILLLAHSYLWKGTKEGVEIVNNLKKKYPQIKLWLYGSRQKNLNFKCDNYFYNLSKKAIVKLYQRTDIYLCPSYYEGFGLGSAEAMASGCAVVTYDNGGSRDFALDGQTAYVALNQNIPDLSAKLEMAIANESERKLIAANGREFIRKMASWPEQTDKLEKFLLSLIIN
jgi:glycosyltransferase involved in cell wall biosynthesis